MNIGTLVTYDDEDPATTTHVGMVVEPTERELAEIEARNAATTDGPIGPENGDVLVEWLEDEPYRYWEHPSYLVEVETANV